MKYISTRGGHSGSTFQQALFSGFLSDGGIYMPESIPTVSRETLMLWKGRGYRDLLKVILPMYIDDADIPAHELNDMIDRAMSKFSLASVVRVERLASGLNVLELFHGKTWAFKDLAMSCVGEFLQYYLERTRTRVTVLVGTSGDTGSSAIEAVRGLRNIDIVVLYPEGRCTKLQELQMTTVMDDNVHVYAVDGSSDDLDEPIKECFMDKEFVEKHSLISINSINWARILVQIVHYFYAYLSVCDDGDVSVVVPTGAAGNITAGILAIKMGLPIHLVSGVNVNDIIHRTLSRGDFSVSESGVTQTLAPAMDIQIPYNMERLWYLVTDGDTRRIKQLMDEFESNNCKLTIPDDIQHKLSGHVSSFVVSDSEIQLTMLTCWQDTGYIMCPHTAIACTYHYRRLRAGEEAGRVGVYIATASPRKFPKAVTSAGILMPECDDVRELCRKDTRLRGRMTATSKGEWTRILKDNIQLITHHATKPTQPTQ